MLNETAKAHRRWANSKISVLGNCCANQHLIKDGKTWYPLPDTEVCEREFHWREYVRLRDNKPAWMPPPLIVMDSRRKYPMDTKRYYTREQIEAGAVA